MTQHGSAGWCFFLQNPRIKSQEKVICSGVFRDLLGLPLPRRYQILFVSMSSVSNGKNPNTLLTVNGFLTSDPRGPRGLRITKPRCLLNVYPKLSMVGMQPLSIFKTLSVPTVLTIFWRISQLKSDQHFLCR